MHKILSGFKFGREKGPKSKQLTLRVDQSSNDGLKFFTLPNEIFDLIFLLARNQYLIPTSRSLTTFPIELTISHVCQLWRSISLDYPLLWDNFRYVIPKYKFVRAKHRFASYIERSRSHPLDIWFNFRADHGNARYNDHTEMFTMLLSQADRWRRVTFLVDGIPPFLHLLKEVHPANLEHFAVLPQQADYATYTPGLFIPSIFTSGALQLKSVRLTTTTHGVFLPPLSNITTFRIEKPSCFSQFIRISLSEIIALLTISSLENLSISDIQFQDSFRDGNFKIIIMERLQDLRCGSEDIAQILPYIQAPCLHSLTLKEVKFPVLDTNSAPELTNLILLDCEAPWPAFSDELSIVASRITHLTVSENSKGTFRLHSPTIFRTPHSWSKLRTLSFNLQFLSYVDRYLELALSLPVDQPLTVRVHQNLLDTWNESTPDLLPHVDGLCKFQGWDLDSSTNPLVPWHWPYAENSLEHPYDSSDYDSFRVTSYH
ncbi:hypothetical protein GALMADRAFT_207349 [Galerina marginata CBS 339.88]|uniref:F-box domain-containing protein n=1 Tax=Galerina marginata (strain CBS 339.88) TaxID=685588 RepID=A0A067TFN0_GALM3|nr:hypothetical protein GALMADRAFT_207349 [Galerina marginata CBS 339.88]